MLPRLDALSHHQRRVLAELGATPSGFVLHGGAALALRLGHRRPESFGFLSTESFDPLRILDRVPCLRGAEVVRRGPDTLECVVDRGGIVRVSFSGGAMRGRVEDPEFAEPPGLEVASLADLAAAAVRDVQVRARAKDRLDVDAAVRLGDVDLGRAFGAAAAVFGDRFDPPGALESLVFFADGDLHKVPESVRERLTRAASWIDPARIPRVTARPGLRPVRVSGDPLAKSVGAARALPVRTRRG